MTLAILVAILPFIKFNVKYADDKWSFEFGLGK